MKSIAPLGLIAAILIAVTAPNAWGGDRDGISVERPWARATILPSRPAVTYLTIVNRGPGDDRLIGVASPVAGHVMVHESKMDDGIMKMTAEDSLAIRSGTTVELKPGGRHLMLMDLRQPLRQGESFPMTLRFEKAGDIDITVSIASPGASGPE